MITIKHFVGLNDTPAAELGQRASAELIENGFGQRIVGLHWSYDCFVAYNNTTPVGFVIYEDRVKSYKDLWLHLSYVIPEHRGRGVFSKLWAALIEKAQAVEGLSINSMTHPANLVMRSVAKMQGRTEVGVQLKFEVPAKDNSAGKPGQSDGVMLI